MSTDKDELDEWYADWNVGPLPSRQKEKLLALISKREQALLLKIGKGDPQNPLVYQARISQELSRPEALTPPKESEDV